MVAVNSLSSEMMCNSPLLSLWHFSFSSEQQQQSSPPNFSPLPPLSSLLPCECQPSSPLFSPPTGSRRRPQRPHNKKHPHLHSPPLARSLAPSLPPPHPFKPKPKHHRLRHSSVRPCSREPRGEPHCQTRRSRTRPPHTAHATAGRRHRRQLPQPTRFGSALVAG